MRVFIEVSACICEHLYICTVFHKKSITWLLLRHLEFTTKYFDCARGVLIHRQNYSMPILIKFSLKNVDLFDRVCLIRFLGFWNFPCTLYSSAVGVASPWHGHWATNRRIHSNSTATATRYLPNTGCSCSSFVVCNGEASAACTYSPRAVASRMQSRHHYSSSVTVCPGI